MVEHYTSDITVLVQLQSDAEKKNDNELNEYSITVSIATFQVVGEVSITSTRSLIFLLRKKNKK